MMNKGYGGVFAIRLRELMAEHNLKQEDLAKSIGVTRQSVSQYLDGSTQPKAEKLYNIAVFFGVTSDYLLGLSNTKGTISKKEKDVLAEEENKIISTLSEGVFGGRQAFRLFVFNEGFNRLFELIGRLGLIFASHKNDNNSKNSSAVTLFFNEMLLNIIQEEYSKVRRDYALSEFEKLQRNAKKKKYTSQSSNYYYYYFYDETDNI